MLGQLPFAMVKACLKVLSEEMLGLSKLQLSAVMSESRCDETHEDRMVEYTLFAPIAAAVIHSMETTVSVTCLTSRVGRWTRAEFYFASQRVPRLTGCAIG